MVTSLALLGLEINVFDEKCKTSNYLSFFDILNSGPYRATFFSFLGQLSFLQGLVRDPAIQYQFINATPSSDWYIYEGTLHELIPSFAQGVLTFDATVLSIFTSKVSVVHESASRGSESGPNRDRIGAELNCDSRIRSPPKDLPRYPATLV